MTLGQRIVVLKDGQIQQIDTPMALYEHPANLFVAGFLGSPAMNVLHGRLERADGLRLVLEAGLSIPLGDARVGEDWLGKPVAMGVRPEHLQPAAPEAAGFDTRVEVVEPVGSEVFVNQVFGTHPLVSRLPPRQLPQAGATLRMAVDPAHLHFFDAGTGRRLW